MPAGTDVVLEDEPAALGRGRVLAGRYVLGERLGTGGMGAVFEAVDQRTDRRLAVKVMRAVVVADADLRARFELEARVTAGIDSPALVPVLDAGIDEATGLPFLVMERLEGEDLGTLLAERGAFPPFEALALVEALARALDATHARGVIHRDLKPENLFLARGAEGPELRVLDFGVAKVVALSQASLRSTRTLGSPLYMSPEQLEGDALIDGRADVYALGHVAFTLLAGQAYWERPWREAKGVYPVLLRMMKGAREVASVRAGELGASLPEGFDAWFAQATARDPDDRFDTAGEAANALRAVIEGRPAPRRASHVRRVRLGVVAVAALGLGVGGLSLWALGAAQAPSSPVAGAPEARAEEQGPTADASSSPLPARELGLAAVSTPPALPTAAAPAASAPTHATPRAASPSAPSAGDLSRPAEASTTPTERRARAGSSPRAAAPSTSSVADDPSDLR